MAIADTFAWQHINIEPKQHLKKVTTVTKYIISKYYYVCVCVHRAYNSSERFNIGSETTTDRQIYAS